MLSFFSGMCDCAQFCKQHFGRFKNRHEHNPGEGCSQETSRQGGGSCMKTVNQQTMIASPMYLENVASESSQLHKSGSSCKKSIRTSRLGASCLMTTQKAMPHRAGALGLPSKYSTR